MKSFFFFAIRLIIAALFIYSGAVKAADPGHFISQIQAFHLVAYSTAYIVAHVLPMLEILCGILLLSLKYSCAASSILAFLTAGFIVVLTILKTTGADLDCGCFGNWNFVKGYTSHVIMNAAIVVLLVIHTSRNAKLQHLLEKH